MVPQISAFHVASFDFNQPLVILLHGWNESAASFDAATLQRFAEYGCVCVATDAPANDASGLMSRYIFDIIQNVKNALGPIVDTDRVALFAYSGGCGNAYSLLSKFPDTFTVLGGFFGMTDYGFDPSDGWYQTNTGFQASIQAAVGNTPGGDINKYRARYLRKGVSQNFRGGFAFVAHDPGDALVDVVHSQNLEADVIAAARTNFQFDYIPGLGHSPPNAPGASLIIGREPDIIARLLTEPAWEIPDIIDTSDRLEVLGELQTKKFTITLGDKVSHAAEVFYNFGTAPDDFIVNPLTGSVSVTIVKGAKTITQTIAVQTTLTVV